MRRRRARWTCWRDAVGTPFYCYSSATLERHYKVFARRAAGRGSLIAFSVKANGNLAVLKTLAQAGRRRRCGVGRRTGQGAGRRHSRRTRSCFPASARPRRKCALALDDGIYQFNVESEPELLALNEVALQPGQARAGHLAHQSRCRCQDPCQDHHRHGGNQIRHSLRPCARGLCPCRDAERHRDRRRRCAYRQPDHRPGAVRSRLPPRRRTGRRICAPTAMPSPAWIWAAAWACPMNSNNNPPPDPAAYGAMVTRGDQRSGLPADLRARPADRRQCRRAGVAGDLCQAWRRQDTS